MRKIRSWLVIPALALTMSLCKFLPVFADQDISVYVNYLGISLDQKPVIENDRLLVPLRAIAENLKLTVCYEDSTKTITAANKAHMIVLTIGSAEAVVDGKTVILDAPAKIINGRTMVPLRFIGESLGLYVEWDGLNRQVDVIEYDYMLSRAVWKDFDYDKAKYCLEMGANPNSSKISPPLSNRCNSNNAEMLKLLFDYGLDPNAVRISKPENEQMITSFACCPEACVFLFVNPSNIDCLKLFIEYGLDLSIKDKFGRTPIDIATERWNKNPQDTDAYELVSLLSSAKQQASLYVAKEGDAEYHEKQSANSIYLFDVRHRLGDDWRDFTYNTKEWLGSDKNWNNYINSKLFGVAVYPDKVTPYLDRVAANTKALINILNPLDQAFKEAWKRSQPTVNLASEQSRTIIDGFEKEWLFELELYLPTRGESPEIAVTQLNKSIDGLETVKIGTDSWIDSGYDVYQISFSQKSIDVTEDIVVSANDAYGKYTFRFTPYYYGY